MAVLCGGADIFGLIILMSAVCSRSVATSGDDPDPGVEPDTVAVRMRGERIGQKPDRAGARPLQVGVGGKRAFPPGAEDLAPADDCITSCGTRRAGPVAGTLRGNPPGVLGVRGVRSPA